MWLFFFFFFPAAFRTLSLSLTLTILIRICLGVDVFGFILFATLGTPTFEFFFSFFRFGKFSVLISSNTYSIPFPSFFLSGPQ